MIYYSYRMQDVLDDPFNQDAFSLGMNQPDLKLKMQISQIFNSSLTYEEFLIKIELISVSLKDAESMFFCDSNIVKALKMHSFKDMFSYKYNDGTLPILPILVDVSKNNEDMKTYIAIKTADDRSSDKLHVICHSFIEYDLNICNVDERCMLSRLLDDAMHSLAVKVRRLEHR